MKVILTSDWQAEWSNLDLCRQAWRQIHSYALDHKIKIVVVAGDLKKHYNPVDVRVTKWWQRAIEKLTNDDIEVLVLLGNHDRVGMYTDADNWLPILKRAGAIVFDKPDSYETNDGTIHLLPYNCSNKALKHQARMLSQLADKKRDILVFHADIKGCSYNVLKQRSEAKFSAEDLHPDSYRDRKSVV